MKLRALLYGATLALSNLLLPAPQAQATTPHHLPSSVHDRAAGSQLRFFAYAPMEQARPLSPAVYG